jgi:glycosyltransferase involved in cell wall biosynthesis
MHASLDASQGFVRRTARILLVPGFVADTYSEIERSFIELCSSPNREIDFIWLVPDSKGKYKRFAKPANRRTVFEPVWIEHLRAAHIPYVIGNISKYNPFSNFLLFRRLFRENHIDAVYTHFGHERYWATLFGRVFRKITIWNEHWHSLGMRHAYLKRVFYRFFIDDFICVSQFIARTLPTGSRVHTVLNAMRPVVDRPPRADISNRRARLGIDTNSVVVLMVAAFTTQKRHHVALEVCRQVLAKRTNVVFVFLGDGVTRHTFLISAANLGIQSSIIAPGYVTDVDPYYAVADICMLTSSREGFGYAVLEAMNHSLPVVVFDSGALPELVENGKTGFLVPESNVDEFVARLIDLIDREDLRAEMGNNARRVVEQKHSRGRWIKQLNATLSAITSRCAQVE